MDKYDKIESLILENIENASLAIDDSSPSERDVDAAKAIEHLTNALVNIHQIKEKKEG